MNWAADRRLDYIDFRMVTVGSVRRSDLMRTFGVSMPQASADINRFLKLYRKAIVYDRSEKQYVARHDGYVSRRGFGPDVLKAIAQLRTAGHPLGWS